MPGSFVKELNDRSIHKLTIVAPGFRFFPGTPRMIWILLFGLITYFFIAQWVSGITRTPVWLLWLVAMMPVFLLVGWAAVFPGRTLPTAIAVLLFVGFLVLYLYLIYRGRVTLRSFGESQSESASQTPRSALRESEPTRDIQPDLSALRPINTAEESTLQTCFPWNVFYLRHIEYRPQSVTCRGQLRTTPEQAHRIVTENIAAQFGDRFYVVLHEGQDHPFFELVIYPAATLDGKSSMIRPAIASGLAILTLITTTWAGLQTVGRVPTIPAILEDGLPYAIWIMVFFALRGFGHYFTARKYHIATTLPYFIPFIPLPFLPLGTIGAFTQLKSPIPDRKALFDIGLVGSFLGLCLCIPLLAWGLTQSSVVPLPDNVGLFRFQALDPKFSIVLAAFAKLAIGKELIVDTGIKLHPTAIAGWVGLVFTAFNLMPIGQLDGGRMVHAVFGRRIGARIGRAARFLLLGFAIVHPHLLLWAVVLLLLSAIDEPALNDVTEVDSFRDIVGLMALTILILIVMPVPRILTTALGI